MEEEWRKSVIDGNPLVMQSRRPANVRCLAGTRVFAVRDVEEGCVEGVMARGR